MAKTCRCGRVIPYGRRRCRDCARAYERERNARLPRKRLRGRAWLALRRQLLTQTGHSCQLCGHHDASGKTLEIHHRIKIQAGGTDNPSSLAVVCRPCHRRAEARSATVDRAPGELRL
jgi:5-methylcytosine-specific restriction endonuclease McrA